MWRVQNGDAWLGGGTGVISPSNDSVVAMVVAYIAKGRHTLSKDHILSVLIRKGIGGDNGGGWIVSCVVKACDGASAPAVCCGHCQLGTPLLLD